MTALNSLIAATAASLSILMIFEDLELHNKRAIRQA